MKTKEEKIYVVYNKWQMDYETWDVYMMKAFLDEKEAKKYRDELEKSGDNDDNFIVEEITLAR